MLQTAPFSQPPPPIPNLSVPPPSGHHFSPHRYHGDRGGHRGHFFQPFRPYPRPGPGTGPDAEFDGKRLRKSVMRKTVDYNSAIIKMLECRVWQRDFRDRRALQPDVTYYPDLMPPPSYVDNPINSVTTRFVKTATNKMRCPIFCMAWTPEGRRLVTGASSGEFTLWNGLTFNFETILQAHDSPVRTMVWSHNDVWMVTGDHAGYVKYWQSNMNNVKMFQAHKEAIRGLSFSPTDHKFVTCSDDGTLRIWDFLRCHEERILRGHGADVKCVHWHPQKGLLVSGSKDNQQPVKLWDPKTGQSLATLHAHKSTVMDIKWNNNGNWLVTASRDHLLKLFDLRNLSQEVQTFRGHKKEASSVAWHPYHEGLFASGGSDGAILFWHVGADKEVGAIEQAHDSIVWTLAWHPLGHILCSGSNDHTSKFWTRNRPGDLMRDKYNLNTLPAGLPGVDDQDVDEPAVIPGMGPEDKVETMAPAAGEATIPGLDFSETPEERHKPYHKKVPYSKPIPRNFQAQWNETGANIKEDDDESEDEESWRLKDPISEVISHLIEANPPPGVIPLSKLQPEYVLIYGKLIPLEGNPRLLNAITSGGDALQRMINSGAIDDLQDVRPHVDDSASSVSDGNGMELETMSDIELPAPLPSSSFARRGGPRRTRFSDAEESRNQMVADQDMRFSSGDVDLRKPPITDQDLRKKLEDSDMRRPLFLADQDLRKHNFPSQGDQDLRDKDLRPPPLLGPHTGMRPNHGSPGIDTDEENGPDRQGYMNQDNWNRNRWGEPMINQENQSRKANKGHGFKGPGSNYGRGGPRGSASGMFGPSPGMNFGPGGRDFGPDGGGNNFPGPRMGGNYGPSGNFGSGGRNSGPGFNSGGNFGPGGGNYGQGRNIDERGRDDRDYNDEDGEPDDGFDGMDDGPWDRHYSGPFPPQFQRGQEDNFRGHGGSGGGGGNGGGGGGSRGYSRGRGGFDGSSRGSLRGSRGSRFRAPRGAGRGSRGPSRGTKKGKF